MNSIPKPILLRLDPVAYEKLPQGSASGRLALSIVRQDGELGDPSQGVSQSFRPRRRRELDYSLFSVSFMGPRTYIRIGQIRH